MNFAISAPIGNNFSINTSFVFGLGPNGLIAGVNFTGTYTNGDFTLSAGYGVGTSGYNLYGGITYYDRPNNQYFSYYANYFGGDPKGHNQLVGGIGYRKKDFSFRLENDFFVRSGDRWRTAAGEIGYGDVVFGFNVYTNNPTKETHEVDYNGTNLLGKKNRWGNGSWIGGLVYSSPAYIGIRQGNSITRFGYSSRWVQDRTQNLIHRNFYPGRQNFYNDYSQMTDGWYSYWGYYNPLTLY
jgi:hypothetical protein